MVRDLGSTNGIRVNGIRMETGRLHPGDELSIAHLRYRFKDAVEAIASGRPRRSHPSSPPPEPVNPWLWSGPRPGASGR